MHSAASTIALAVNGEKNSKYVVSWALAKFVPEGKGSFKLLHVRPQITVVPTPNDAASAYRQEIEWETSQKLLPYKQMCEQRKVEAEVMVIESDNVCEAISRVIGKFAITTLVIGSSYRNIFTRRFRGEELTSRILECLPSFCTVYVVSKGKLSSVQVSTSIIGNTPKIENPSAQASMTVQGYTPKNGNRSAQASMTILGNAPKSENSSNTPSGSRILNSSNTPSGSQILSSSKRSEFNSTDISTNSSLRRPPLSIQRNQALASINYNSVNTRPGVSDFLQTTNQSSSKFYVSADTEDVNGKISSYKNFQTENKSWSSDQASRFRVQTDTSLSQTQVDVSSRGSASPIKSERSYGDSNISIDKSLPADNRSWTSDQASKSEVRTYSSMSQTSVDVNSMRSAGPIHSQISYGDSNVSTTKSFQADNRSWTSGQASKSEVSTHSSKSETAVDVNSIRSAGSIHSQISYGDSNVSTNKSLQADNRSWTFGQASKSEVSTHSSKSETPVDVNSIRSAGLVHSQVSYGDSIVSANKNLQPDNRSWTSGQASKSEVSTHSSKSEIPVDVSAFKSAGSGKPEMSYGNSISTNKGLQVDKRSWTSEQASTSEARTYSLTSQNQIDFTSIRESIKLRTSFPESNILARKSSQADNPSWTSGQASTSEVRTDSSISQNQVDISHELQRMRLELKHFQKMFEDAQSESADASRQLHELSERRMEEEVKLKVVKYREEMARELAREERERREVAERAAEVVKEYAEKEALQRRDAEKNAAREAKEKQRLEKALTYLDEQYQKYTWDEIEYATSSFSDSLKIGKGANGTVYKGTFHHTIAAVKVLNSSEGYGTKQFHQELEILSKIRHPHLLLLLGACPERGCLIYEYMENGSLEDRLLCKNNTHPIPWYYRFRIAWEVASALVFLHNTKPKPIIHRDLKPANILLDRNYVSKIGDVGLSTLVPAMNLSMATMIKATAPVGTFCYIDPEYQRTGMVSTKSDIYALGMVILQLLTSKPPMGLSHHVERALEDECLKDILDPGAGDWPPEETQELATLALKCCELKRRDRPDLKEQIVPLLEKLKDFADKAHDYALHAPSAPPSHFICPILQEIMDDPCVASDGYTYDRKAIEIWFAMNDKSPMTNLPLPNKFLIPNHSLRSAIMEWRSRTQ